MIISKLYFKDNYVTISFSKKISLYFETISSQKEFHSIRYCKNHATIIWFVARFFENNNIGSYRDGNFKWYTMYVIFRGRFMYLQFRSSHACKKRIFALRHVIFRPATGYDSRNSGDVQMVSSIAFTWFMKFVFARSFYLVLFHIFFFYFPRSMIIFHISYLS